MVKRLEMKKGNITLTEEHKYEFLTGEEILPPDQRRLIEKVFIFSFNSDRKFTSNNKPTITTT